MGKFSVHLFVPFTAALSWLLLLIVVPSFVLRHPDRLLLRQRRRAAATEPIGTVQVDFYRTFETVNLIFFRWTAHSISSWRIHRQLQLLNFWYEGRVNFEMGDIYCLDAPDMHVIQGSVTACGAIFNFSSSNSTMTRSRIAVVYVKFIDDLFGCASSVDAPMDGSSAPSVIIAMNNNNLNIPFVSLAAFGGGTVAHEIGHLLGFEHTHTSYESEWGVSYDRCDLDLLYPRFGETDEFAYLNVTYKDTDWNSRSNVMSPFSMDHIFNLFQVGIFRARYSEIFEDIVKCWFERSTEIE